MSFTPTPPLAMHESLSTVSSSETSPISPTPSLRPLLAKRPHSSHAKRPRPPFKLKLTPFDFVPTPKVSSLPPCFYSAPTETPAPALHLGLWTNNPHSACSTTRGHRRRFNEDRVFADHASAIYGVCDGHGSGTSPYHLAADTAKRLLPSLLKSMSIPDAFIELDRRVLAELDKLCVVGTTVALVRVHHKARLMQVAHVGDSRVVIIGGDGSARTLTTDHSPDRPDEIERIENSGGYVLNGRVNQILAVTRAIGDNALKYVVPPTPDVLNHQLKADDQLVVIATDGLWDMVSDSGVAKLISSLPQRRGAVCVPEELQSAADAVVKCAVDRGSGDDTSVVLIDVRSRVR